jgi:hypothetical protein
MRTFFVSVMLVTLAGAANAQIFTPQYDGPDKGYLVISIGGVRSAREMTFAPIVLFYRKLDGSRHGSVRYARLDWMNPMTQRPDYRDSDEAGAVVVRSLEPGSYEFHSFLGHRPGQNYDAHFSIPFTIRAGQITYAGDYCFVEEHGSGALEITRVKESFFVVRDRSSRDLPLARLKEEHPVGSVNIEIPDLTTARSALFRPDQQTALAPR